MVSKIDLKGEIVCVVGLGYVGLPLAEVFSKYFKVIGFGTSSIESWFIKDLVFSPFGGWDAEKWYHF